MDLVEHWPPSIVKDKVYTFNEDYLSHFCSFMRLMLSMPPYLVLLDIDMEYKFGCCKGGPSHGAIVRLLFS